MDYLKISEIANQCEVKRRQINEYYRIIGGNSQFPEDVKDILYSTINDLNRDATMLENKLRKCVNNI